MLRVILILLTFCTCFLPSHLAIAESLPNPEPDWSSTLSIPQTGRPNPFNFSEAELAQVLRKGKLHAVQYPVEMTGLLMPARSTLKILNAKPGETLFEFMRKILNLKPEFKSFTGFWNWLGLSEYPTDGSVPRPEISSPMAGNFPMGVSLIEKNGATGVTLSCAACHSSTLFGKPILGMSNRFPRANLFFHYGNVATRLTPTPIYTLMTGANHAEQAMYRDTRHRMPSVGIKKPATLGLDTSLAQVALSLAKRAPTEWAERTKENAKHPRPNLLETLVADSKPAVWWNVKYKTRWLSDGSVISGNPVFTNFLWNEIGRGIDLPPLVEWMKENPRTVQELTTSVFSTQAPKWSEFFGKDSIEISRAVRGEKIFAQSCAKCHGQYIKNWEEGFETVQVRYHEKTFVKDVGTDPGRRLGMKALAEALNPLAFSKEFNIVIEEQPGYVPPPLEGIWARYPYFHNNSIPNLCALMTPPEKRPVTYYSGMPVNKDTDYDQNCVGYPLGSKTPNAWKKDPEYLYDSRKPGLSNSGHYKKIFLNDAGEEKYTAEDKRDLIEYLKTL